MAQATWEKTEGVISLPRRAFPKRTKFAFAGGAILLGMAVLMLAGTLTGGRFFMPVSELMSRPDLVGQTVKISGAVVGSTIRFDPDTKTIYFTMANVTDDANVISQEGGLAAALHQAVIDPKVQRINVQVPNQAMPDLLKDEAQAIVTGKLGTNGVFVADELLLKCPSKYSSDLPQQSQQ